MSIYNVFLWCVHVPTERRTHLCAMIPWSLSNSHTRLPPAYFTNFLHSKSFLYLSHPVRWGPGRFLFLAPVSFSLWTRIEPLVEQDRSDSTHSLTNPKIGDPRWSIVVWTARSRSRWLGPRVAGSVVCTLRGRSSARKLGPESWRSAVWLRSGPAVESREGNPPWLLSRLATSQCSFQQEGAMEAVLGAVPMRGGGPRVTREDPVVMIVMSVRAASSEAALGVERGAREGPARRLSPFFHILALSPSLCNITTTSPNELVTVMQISPTGLKSTSTGDAREERLPPRTDLTTPTGLLRGRDTTGWHQPPNDVILSAHPMDRSANFFFRGG